MFLRQNTLQPINFGPFLSSSDGFTPQTGLTIATSNMELSKDGGAFFSIASGSAVHDVDGWYTANLTADDVDTVGELKFKAMMTGTSTLPVWDRWYVIEEDIYDAFYGASAGGFDANQRVSVGFMQTGTVTAAALATDAVDEIVDGVWDEVSTAQIPELTGIADIPATPTILQSLMLTYMRERNDYQTTSSERRILNDAGVEVLDAPMSDNGTFSQGKLTDA